MAFAAQSEPEVLQPEAGKGRVPLDSVLVGNAAYASISNVFKDRSGVTFWLRRFFHVFR